MLLEFFDLLEDFGGLADDLAVDAVADYAADHTTDCRSDAESYRHRFICSAMRDDLVYEP